MSCFADAPDVTVLAHNTTTANNWIDIVCSAHGVPDTYNNIKWVHTWPGHESVLNTYTDNLTLRLIGLTYAHNGIYTCYVENGVETSQNVHAGVGSTYLTVKGRYTSFTFVFKKESY